MLVAWFEKEFKAVMRIEACAFAAKTVTLMGGDTGTLAPFVALWLAVGRNVPGTARGRPKLPVGIPQ